MHTTTTTFSTYGRRTGAPVNNRNRDRNYGPAPARVNARPQLATKPVHFAPDRDFYLDTFFNPLWMSGPHVFSFAEDGKVVRPAKYPVEPCPGYRGSAASASRRDVHGARATSSLCGPSRLSSTSTSKPLPRADVSKPPARKDKPWKNVAISEQDDAEFATMEAEAVVRAQVEAKSQLVGRVYTWPPEPQPAPCAECEALAMPRRREVVGTVGTSVAPRARTSHGARTAPQEGAVPALSYGSSGESESTSEVFKVVPGRKAVGGPLEKSVGSGRVARKAPLVLAGLEEGESESKLARFVAHRGLAQVDDDGFSNPFKHETWVEDDLTARLKAILRLP